MTSNDKNSMRPNRFNQNERHPTQSKVPRARFGWITAKGQATLYVQCENFIFKKSKFETDEVVRSIYQEFMNA